MSIENASEAGKITPLQAYNLLVQLSQIPDLRLNLKDHTNIQIALETIKPLVQPIGEALKPVDAAE